MLAAAQPLPAGNWSYKIFNANVVQLTWQHAALDRAEQISDAVLWPNKVLPKLITNQPTLAAGFGLTQDGGEARLVLPNGKVLQFVGFDSGHVRGMRHLMPTGTIWHGGGERTLPMQRNGQRIVLYNQPQYAYELNANALNYSVPFVMGSGGYGLFFDNPAKGYIDFGKTIPETMEAGFVAGRLDVYVILGNSASEILA
ncbi:MAG: hypothetical protein EAY75_14760, partial [Bacteroidetes bacterium]